MSHKTFLTNTFTKYLLVILVGVAVIFPQALLAQNLNDDPRYAEAWKKLQPLNDQLSLDTTPVEFNIGDVHYKVPRNYIANMDNYNGGPQSLVRFKVTFPEFEPYSDQTKDCLTLAPAYLPKGCIPVRFSVISRTEVSDDEAFRNASKLFHSQTPKDGSYGFEMYETGPDNARGETYRKQANDHTLVIHCLVGDIHKKRNPTCKIDSRLKNQNGLEYFIYKSQLKDAEQIDGGLRKLLESFTVTGGKQ